MIHFNVAWSQTKSWDALLILPVSGGHVRDADAEDNAQVYVEQMQGLDDTGLNLVFRCARSKEKEVLEILRAHYLLSENPRFIVLYT